MYASLSKRPALPAPAKNAAETGKGMAGNSISQSSLDILKNYSSQKTAGVNEQENVPANTGQAGPLPATETANNTNTEIEMNFNAFIPNEQNHLWFEDDMAWLDEPGSIDTLFSSDNRTYKEAGTSRIAHKAKITLDKNGKLVSQSFSAPVIGASHQAEPIYETVGYTPLHPTKDWIGGRPIKKISGLSNKKTETAPNKGDNTYTKESWGHNFNMRGEASYPFSAFAPDIDFNVNYMVIPEKIDGKNLVAIGVFGMRNNFPAYEGFIKINGVRKDLYEYRVDKSDGPGLINLNTSSLFSGDAYATTL